MMLKLFLLLSLLLGNIAANTIEDAKKLFDDQKYEEAIQIFNANDHDGEAQYYLGKSYYYGLGVKKDLKKAYYHTHQSSINKNPSGINLLGVMYQYGEGVEKDEVRAFSLYTEAANLGSPKAMANIGMLFYSDNDSIKNDYVQSYEYILNATQQGEFGNTVFMYEMVSKKLVSQDKYNESIYWLKKAADPLVNKTNSLSKAQYVLYSYYQKTNQSPQAIELATSAYSNGDILLGCMLSFDYKNENTIESFKKAHFIASEVISSNPKIYEATRCAYTLADLYIQGNYVAKDINKAITTLETAFNKYDNLDHITAAWIAKLYFNILNDELNGTKWYQIAYDLSNNFSYLNEITRYKKRFSHINDDNLTTLNHKQLYPLLYNFIKPTQIMSGLESKKYFFFATDQKSIKIYNKRSLTLFNELRGEVGNGIDGVTIGMAFDENSELLYCSSILNKYDQNANAIIRVYNINSGKIVKTLKDAPSFVGSELDISDDGIYLLSFNTSSEIKLINTITHQLQEYKLLGKKLTNGKIRKEGDDYYAYILTDHNLLYKFSVNNKILISVEPFLNQIVFKTLDVENAKNIFINNNSDITKIILKNKQIHLQKNTSRNFITFDFLIIHISF